MRRTPGRKAGPWGTTGMTNEQDDSERGAYVKPQARPEVSVLPPLEIPIDSPEARYERLARIVSDHVVSRLLALHGQMPGAVPLPVEGGDAASNIEELAHLLLGPENDEAEEFLLRLRDGGVSLEDLHTELLEPTAHRFGELWNEDKIDFVDVTLGVARLQRLVHAFGRLDQVPDYDAKRKVLLACAPGEQHSLGSSIVQKSLRAAGWHVCTCATMQFEDAAELAAQEWFGVVGFSLGSDVHVDRLSAAIAQIRSVSMNPKVGIMVGGSAISRNPGWVKAVGADGTAANGPAAVILAKKLLAASLL